MQGNLCPRPLPWSAEPVSGPETLTHPAGQTDGSRAEAIGSAKEDPRGHQGKGEGQEANQTCRSKGTLPGHESIAPRARPQVSSSQIPIVRPSLETPAAGVDCIYTADHTMGQG